MVLAIFSTSSAISAVRSKDAEGGKAISAITEPRSSSCFQRWDTLKIFLNNLI
jgi:hypothetical protein